MRSTAAAGDPALLREAAILLLAMGEDEAAKVLKLLEPREVQRVGAAMAALGSVHSRQLDRVVDRFLETVSGAGGHVMGANDYLRTMLLGGLGERRGRALRRRPRAGFAGLRWMDARTIGQLLRDESADVRAILLSYLPPARAAAVLTLLPGSAAKAHVVVALIRLASRCSRKSQDRLPGAPRRMGRRNFGRVTPLGGADTAAAVLAHLGRGTRQAVLAEVRELDPEAGEMLESAVAPEVAS